MMSRESKLALFILSLLALPPLMPPISAGGSGANVNHATNSIHHLSPGLAAQEITDRMVQQLKQRDELFRQYSVDRTYEVKTNDSKPASVITARMYYNSPPAAKKFHLLSKINDGTVGNMVYERAIKAEKEMLEPALSQRTSLSPENYDFTLVGTDKIAGTACYVVAITAKRQDKFLFNGRLWVSTDNYDLVRVEGSPAKNPSIWIKKLSFVRQFQKVNGFWLPGVDESEVDVRLYGRIKVRIEHRDYQMSRG